MKLRKFKAPSMREAVQRVKDELGPNALIISTRQVRRGLLGSGVEVTATVEDEPEEVDTLLPPEPVATPRGRAQSPGRAVSTYHRTHAESPSTRPAPASSLDAEALERVLAPLKSELRTITAQLRPLAAATRERDHKTDVEQLRTALLSQTQAAIEAAHGAKPTLAASGQASPPEMVLAEPSRSRVVALVGPTGAGKTTTIAKLAARAALLQKQSVAIVSVDTYRVGAEAQMRIFADLIGVPLIMVLDLAKLASTIESLGAYDTIFIDTWGRSPRDTKALSELVQAIGAIDGAEMHLVLPATATRSQNDAWVGRYGAMNVHRLLFTKIDEADVFSEMVEAPARHRKAVTWLTTGNRVPEDIEEATSARLRELAKSGFIAKGEAA